MAGSALRPCLQLSFRRAGDAASKPSPIRSSRASHRDAHLSAVYLQPVAQNPLGMTMPPARRTDVLRVVEKLDLLIIEDMVYGFLDDEPPLASLAPDRCVVFESLSKIVSPGLSLGMIVAP